MVSYAFYPNFPIFLHRGRGGHFPAKKIIPGLYSGPTCTRVQRPKGPWRPLCLKVWYGVQLNQISPFTFFELWNLSLKATSVSTMMTIMNLVTLAEMSDDHDHRNILPPITFCEENTAAATISHKLKTAKCSKWNQREKMTVKMKLKQICFRVQKE